MVLAGALAKMAVLAVAARVDVGALPNGQCPGVVELMNVSVTIGGIGGVPCIVSMLTLSRVGCKSQPSSVPIAIVMMKMKTE